MAFSQKKIYLVIALTIISLVGIVVVQYFWIDAAYNTQQEQFDQRMNTLRGEISNSIQSDKKLENSILAHANDDMLPSVRSFIYDIPNPLPYYWLNDSTLSGGESPLSQSVLKRKIRTKIDSVFAANNFNIAYEFGLVEHHNSCAQCGNEEKKEEVIFSTMSGTDLSPIVDTKYKTCTPVLMGYAHLNLHFPNKGFFIAKQIGWMLGLSIIGILIIVGCFGYTILTIRKQKKLAEMKNDFINNMTHEFKTPIFSISLASKALGNSQQVQQSEKLNSYLNLIHDESKRLKAQVDKVLKMTLADSDYSTIEKEKVDLHKLLKNVVSNFELILSEKNGKISLDLDAEKHIIHADKTHLTNIIQNLIDNAVKYSKQQPDISITTEDEGEGISFSITDNGIGMDSETKQHIFDKFYRAQSGDIHDVKGFGLGLSYVKNIVEAHKGRIKLNSKLNKGSTFTIFLPA